MPLLGMHLSSGLARAALILLAAVPIGYYLRQRYLLPPPVMDGVSSHDFKPVARLFKALVESRAELGGAFAVYHRGQSVLEMTGGYRDLEYLVPWSENTLSYGMSIAKGAAALCLAHLVDQGRANYSDPVAKHWPEFAANGKEGVTLRQLLSHQAGLISLDKRLTLTDLAEVPQSMIDTLANQAPQLQIGTVAYHALTYGLYADQLVRRLDAKGRSIDQYFHDELVKPTKVEAYLGLSRYQFYRLARVHFSIAWNLLTQLATLDFDGLNAYLLPAYSRLARQASFGVLDTDVYLNRLNDPEVAALSYASVNLVANAPGLARLFSLFASNGSVDGNRILGANTLAALLDWDLAAGTASDPVTGLAFTFNAGFALRRSPLGSTMIGHLGFGGQMVWSDPEHSVTVSYLTNHLRACSPNRDAVHAQLISAVYEVVAKLEAKGK